MDDSLGFPYFRLLNIWWFPSLKIKNGDSLTWKLPHFHFMFLIDMKFRSKLLEMCLWKMYHFSILISTNVYKEKINKYIYIYIYSCFEKKRKHEKCVYTFQQLVFFQILRYEKYVWKMIPWFSCTRWSILVIIGRSTGPDFYHIFEVPKNI